MKSWFVNPQSLKLFALLSGALLSFPLASRAGQNSGCVSAGLQSIATLNAEKGSHGFLADPVQQWLRWEQESNVSYLQQSTEPVELGFVHAPRASVDIDAVSDLPAAIRARFLPNGEYVNYPKHPYNKALVIPEFEGHRPVPNAGQRVPHAESPAAETTPAALTASRSIAFPPTKGQTAYTVKMPTSNPHPKLPNATKLNVHDEIKVAVPRTRYFDAIDAEFGADPELLLLRDVLSVRDKATGNGYIVRDLSNLKTDHYYFPAFSIPHEGADIARANHAPFPGIWDDVYAEKLGRTKAKMLLRYGFQMESPNPQNFLIEFDPLMKPTGRIVYRDMVDGHFFKNAIDGLGDAEVRKAAVGKDIHNRLVPNTSTSFWRMDQGTKHIDEMVLIGWGWQHDAAYIAELKKSLQLSSTRYPGHDFTSIKEIETFLLTDQGKEAFQKYRQRLAAGEASR